MQAKEGNMVKVHYTGKLEDGTVFDSSEGKEPLIIKLGDHKVIKGFEEALTGMTKGDKKTISIKKEEAYGDRNDQLVSEIPKAQLGNLPENVELKPGITFQLQDPSGRVVLATVKEVKEETILLDLNHPLAGKDLTFDIEVVDVMEGKPKQEAEAQPEAQKVSEDEVEEAKEESLEDSDDSQEESKEESAEESKEEPKDESENKE